MRRHCRSFVGHRDARLELPRRLLRLVAIGTRNMSLTANASISAQWPLTKR
jgi:hypothetical protein